MKTKLFMISNIKIQGSLCPHPDVYIASHGYYEDKKFIIYIDGWTYPKRLRESEIIDTFLSGRMNTLEGEYSIYIFDKQTTTLSIYNDRIGRYSVFLYYFKDTFIVSNDWDSILKNIPKNEYDLDRDSLIESIFMHYPLDDKTIIKNISYLPMASNVTYNFKNNSLTKKTYFDFHYKIKVRNTSIKHVVDEFYQKLDEAFDFIVEDVDLKYSFGVSGGLDSRIVPHFLHKQQVKKVFPFISGSYQENKLKRFVRKNIFTPININSASNICKKYNYELNIIDVHNTDIKAKIKGMLTTKPFGYHNLNYYTDDIPNDIDIHIAASGPLSISRGEFGEGSGVGDDRQLVTKIISDATLLGTVTGRPSHSFGHSLMEVLPVPGILSKSIADKLVNKVYEYVKARRPRNDVDIYENYLLNLSRKNMNAPFEGVSRKARSVYTIYYPFCFDFVRSLEPKYFEDRYILKELFNQKITELSTIPEEARPISPQRNKIRELYYKGKMKLGGYYFPGLHEEELLFMHNEIKYHNNDVGSIFDIDNISLLNPYHRKILPQIAKMSYYLETIK